MLPCSSIYIFCSSGHHRSDLTRVQFRPNINSIMRNEWTIFAQISQKPSEHCSDNQKQSIPDSQPRHLNTPSPSLSSCPPPFPSYPPPFLKPTTLGVPPISLGPRIFRSRLLSVLPALFASRDYRIPKQTSKMRMIYCCTPRTVIRNPFICRYTTSDG